MVIAGAVRSLSANHLSFIQNPVGDSDEEDEDFSTVDTYASYIPAKGTITIASTLCP